MPLTDPCIIRPQEPRDMSAITEIYAHHVLHGASSWELEPPDIGEMRRRANTLIDSGYPYLVAENEDGVQGFAYAGPYRPRPAYRFTVEHSVYINDRSRRGGIGRDLLAALIEECTKRGFRQMIAIVGDSRNTQSISFHEKMGFAQVGTVRNIGFKFERWMDQVILQRELGPGATTLPD